MCPRRGTAGGDVPSVPTASAQEGSFRMATPIAQAAPQGSHEPAAPILARACAERPDWADAGLFLADGTAFWGKGAGAPRTVVGEVVFNTAMTGYQEILTDPSY